MIYSPECVAAFEVFAEKTGWHITKDEAGRYTDWCMTATLAAFAANWERVRELEGALRAFVDNSSIQANHPHECEQAEELLEKGNE